MNRTIFCFALLLLCSVRVDAAGVVIPSSAQTQEGSTSGFFGTNSGLVSQELYRASDISGLQIGDAITGFSLRLNGGGSSFPSSQVTWSQFDIKIGPGISNLTTTFANNFASAPTTVRTGSLVMDPGFFPGTGSPRDFSSVITFSTPYVYTGGDLLIELRTVSPSEALSIDTMTLGQTSGQSVFAGGDSNATIATTSVFDHNWAMQLQTTPVPEPSSFMLIGITCLGFAAWRLGKRVA